jgi:hypothetical protein
MTRTPTATADSITSHKGHYDIGMDLSTIDAIKATPGQLDSRWFRPTRALVVTTRSGKTIEVSLFGPERLPASGSRPARDRENALNQYRIYDSLDLQARDGQTKLIKAVAEAARAAVREHQTHGKV